MRIILKLLRNVSGSFEKHATPINYYYLIKDVILAEHFQDILQHNCAHGVFRNKEFSFFPMHSTMHLLRKVCCTPSAPRKEKYLRRKKFARSDS